MKFCAVVLLFVFTVVPGGYTQANPYQPAGDYSREHNGDAVFVFVDNAVAFEDYQNGYAANQLHPIASGTKSFTCVLAVLAQMDGLLTLDETAADTLTEWQDDPQKSTITVRQLLSQTDGVVGGREFLQGQLAADNRVETALEIPLGAPVGEAFQYGPSHFYLFDALLQRKLGVQSTVEYLTQRVLDPIGMSNFVISRDPVGNPNWAAGVATTARSWAKFGLLILNNGKWGNQQILDADLLQECFVGTSANPYYGLAWWLLYNTETDVNLTEMAIIAPTPGDIPDGVILGETAPLVMIAAGAAQQRLYVVPSWNAVIVRLGRQDRTFDDVAFLRLIQQGWEQSQ